MKINIYDLTGNEQFSLVEDDGLNDINIKDKKIVKLRTLLINPRDYENNRTPYLQLPTCPFIEDFRDENGNFDFSNSFFLSEMLKGNLTKERVQNLTSFFAYENEFLRTKSLNCGEYNILLIPDHYNTEKQEILLRCCGLPRHNTFLLWRSVAICLGAEKKLQEYNIQEGEKVAIVDPQADGTFNVSILTMCKDKDNDKDSTTLVPARRAFNNNSKYYPVSEEKMISDKSSSSSLAESFWKHTWQKNGRFWCPMEDGTWKLQTFSKPEFKWNILDLKEKIDYCITCGQVTMGYYPFWKVSQIIQESSSDSFAITGAGRFAVRNANGYPTYFDECESLHFIVFDMNEEKYLSRELISGQELCKGGKEFKGKENKEFFLEKDSDKVTFRLYTGKQSDTAPLKKLEQAFGVTTIRRQTLILYPTMIPGQGIAKVRIEASPLLPNSIELDFLSMEKDQYSNEKGEFVDETIKHLQATLKRSFPIDFPEVESSPSLFRENVIREYISGHKMLDSTCFAKTRFPNSKEPGLNQFMRINVFGTKQGKQYPSSDMDMINKLFKKIANDYNRTNNLDYVTLAAWTYRCGHDYFQPIISNVLSKIQRKARGAQLFLQQQEYTVCSNMLSIEEQYTFIQCFIQYAKPILKEARNLKKRVKNVDWWIRALMGILTYSNDCLKKVPSNECEECMDILKEIWKSYSYNGKEDPYIAKVICCLLFLLRRRKYDHGFLKDKNTELYQQLQELCSIEDNQSFFNKKYKKTKMMSKSLNEYLNGEGTLDGTPVGDLLNDGN